MNRYKKVTTALQSTFKWQVKDYQRMIERHVQEIIDDKDDYEIQAFEMQTMAEYHAQCRAIAVEKFIRSL